MLTILTKKLLETKKKGTEIKPRYREPRKHIEEARTVINEFKTGRSRGEIEEAVKSHETHQDFKFLRALHALIERRCSFENKAKTPPQEIRSNLYSKGYVTDKKERDRLIRETAREYNIDPLEVEEWFWADRKENEILKTNVNRNPTNLIKQYNLSATQTLLFDALEIKFNVTDNYRQIFGILKYLGLMYTVNPNLDIKVTGPGSLFKKTRKYGNQLARLLPYIMKSSNWKVSAKIEKKDRGEPRIYNFHLDDSKQDYFPYMKTDKEQSFDSEVERDLANRLEKIKTGWQIKREPTIIKSGNSVMIPDFSFEKYNKSFYLEVVGFWTPEYIEKKIKKVKNMEADKPVILAVNKNLKCTKQDFNQAEEVFFYKKRIPLKKIIKRMEKLEEEAVNQQIKKIDVTDITEKKEITDIKKKANEKNVPPETIKKKLKKHQGAVCENKYIPPNKIKEIKTEINKLSDKKLPKVKKILKKHNLTESSLEKLGYTAKWKSFNPEDVQVTPKKQKKD
ncbi:DUF790 family protein [Methanonatronarchaeum sp. AMET-Sl]|uniref:DUF790 family protein n=1 Tax=Methanonatronarchaeum sp. AMET-Sl TaxID=3037654 RepID=UPI00244DFAF7|nr:DUF790 family protein [Methanonatronarchaeum sp. AMET-Sl]WGI17354.1 DUF790 family protein [Methanonatronarchaeum sp. AMET-Sl]